MKIRELRVKHFGKFQNARICLRDGINLVAGRERERKIHPAHLHSAACFSVCAGCGGELPGQTPTAAMSPGRIPPSIPENWFLKAEASGSGFPEISAEIRLQSV